MCIYIQNIKHPLENLNKYDSDSDGYDDGIEHDDKGEDEPVMPIFKCGKFQLCLPQSQLGERDSDANAKKKKNYQKLKTNQINHNNKRVNRKEPGCK